MASSYTLEQVKQDNYAFMSCVLKVHTDTPGWQKTVMKVLNNIQGVHNFKMDEGGMIEVSGKVSPTLLLKMLGKAGKKAEIIWWQFGECSSNLFVPVPYGDGYGNYGNYIGDNGGGEGVYRATRYDHHTGYCDHEYEGGISYYRNDTYVAPYGVHPHGVHLARPKPWYNPFLGSRKQARNEGAATCCIMM